jgi:hypothetical protein
MQRTQELGADYQMLVGQRFDSTGVAWVVCSVVWMDNHWTAQAEPVHICDDSVRRPSPRPFHVNYVLRRIVVDEEIELFPPRWASGEMH